MSKLSKLSIAAFAAFMGGFVVLDSTSKAIQDLTEGKNPQILGKAFITAANAYSAPQSMSGFGSFAYKRFQQTPELADINLLYHYSVIREAPHNKEKRDYELELALILDRPVIKVPNQEYPKTDAAVKEALILHYAAPKYGHVTTSESLLDAALKKLNEEGRINDVAKESHKQSLEIIKARQLAFPNIPLGQHAELK